MTNRFMKAALAGTVFATAFVSTSAQAATAVAAARARIIQAVTVNQTADLDFASIVTGAAASTVVVSTGGVRTCGAGLVCTGTTTAAGFNIVGSVGSVVTIASDPSVLLNRVGGGGSMTATLLTSAATRTLTGTDPFTVGGTLGVGAAQADGNYLGNFTVTVNYQ